MPTAPRAASTKSFTLLSIIASGAALAIVAVAAFALHSTQARSLAQLEQRHRDRAALATSFLESYVTGLMDREQDVAQRLLSSADTTDLRSSFDGVVAAFGFSAAVLLDDKGRVLAVAPYSPATLGKQISIRYAHLGAAVAGSRAVSVVVPSAVTGRPVSAFAVPYDTPGGRRVLSGAYELPTTPLGPFMRNASVLRNSSSFLIDRKANVVASNRSNSAEVVALQKVDPALAQASAVAQQGFYGHGDDRRYFASKVVAGTPWTLVTSVPSAALFAPVQGASRIVAWVLIGLLALALLIAVRLGVGFAKGRDALRESNRRLERAANTDELTGLFNRRRLREQLVTYIAAGRRHNHPVAVALLDVDRFKLVNDTFGHSSGDAVLQTVAGILAREVRGEDLLCRWGGEEFLLVLPHLTLDGAAQAADRVRRLVEAEPISVGKGGDVIHVTVSVGVALCRADEHPDTLIHRADLALYKAKAAGRNQVITADDAGVAGVAEGRLSVSDS